MTRAYRAAVWSLTAGLVLFRVLSRSSKRGDPARSMASAAPLGTSGRAAGRPRALGAVMLAALVIGLVLMLGFEGTITRIVGVSAMFAFIVSGVFLIADPSFLEPEDDGEEPGGT